MTWVMSNIAALDGQYPIFSIGGDAHQYFYRYSYQIRSLYQVRRHAEAAHLYPQYMEGSVAFFKSWLVNRYFLVAVSFHEDGFPQDRLCRLFSRYPFIINLVKARPC